MRNASPYQLSCFDLQPVEKSAVVLDMKVAEKRRDEGIEEAVAHANGKVTSWSAKAYEIIKDFLLKTHGEFMVEQVREYAYKRGFETPASARAWGGPIRRASHDGLIVFVRNQKTKNVKAHSTPAAVWRKVINE
jgi:hypothetical protein